MKINEIRSKSIEELKSQIIMLAKERLKLRFLRASGEQIKTSKMRETRKLIAKIKTVLQEKLGEKNA